MKILEYITELIDEVTARFSSKYFETGGEESGKILVYAGEGIIL